MHAIRGDGTEFPVEIGLNPITTERDSMVLASIIDTSERKKQENIITRQMIELQLKNKEMEQFNYIASHDLQELLRTLSNYLLLIEEDHGNDLSDEYNLMKSDYNSVITKLEKQLGNTNFEKGDIEDLMGKGLNNLISLGSAYENGTLADAREMIGLIYPENFTFRGNSFQTARVNEIMKCIYLVKKELKIKKTGQKTISSLCPE